jgi:hypothetical protein
MKGEEEERGDEGDARVNGAATLKPLHTLRAAQLTHDG